MIQINNFHHAVPQVDFVLPFRKKLNSPAGHCQINPFEFFGRVWGKYCRIYAAHSVKKNLPPLPYFSRNKIFNPQELGHKSIFRPLKNFLRSPLLENHAFLHHQQAIS
jgi:hypothetical protein